MFALLFVALVAIPANDALRILSIMHTPSPSHHIFNRVLNLDLVKRGHHVTVISADVEKNPPKENYRHYVVEGLYDIKEHFDYEMLADQSLYSNVKAFFDWCDFVCKKTVNTNMAKTILQLAKNETFDLIMYEMGLTDCTLGFISEFNYPPIVGISAYGWAPWISWYSGIPEDYEYIAASYAEYEPPLNFMQKLETSIFNWYTMAYYRWIHLPQMMNYGRILFGDKLPNYDSILKNTSLYLINVNIARDYPRPLSPEVITVGGMHMEKAKPLPKDLQKWMDDSKEGVILFSLGTNVRSDKLSKYNLDIFLNTFAKLKEKVLWKYESDLQNVPPNVKILKWIPQGDLFDHPNMRLFITHGGGMSTNEAIYHGIPVVIIPFLFDQNANAEKLQLRGMGLRIFLKEMSENDQHLFNVIRRVIDEPSFKEKALQLQKIYKDEPLTPLDKTVYWLEYVVRHRGAKHLQLASRQLTWYQMGHFDFLALFLITAFVAMTVVISIVYLIYNKIISNKNCKTKVKKS